MSAERIVTPSSNHGEWARLLRSRAAELVAAAAAAVRHPRAVIAVLVALAAHADRDGCCHPSHETIARATAFSTRHVQRALDQAEAAGLIARSVPRYGARVLGATTRYALPWWAEAARAGLRGAARVQRELPIATDPQSVAVARALRDAAPAALLGAVLRELPPALQADVIRAGVPVLIGPRRPAPGPGRQAPAVDHGEAMRAIVAAVEAVPCAPDQTTRGREKTSPEVAPGISASSRGAAAPETRTVGAKIAALGARVAALARR